MKKLALTFALFTAAFSMSYAEKVVTINGSGGATQEGDKLTLCPEQTPQSICATIHSEMIAPPEVVEVEMADGSGTVMLEISNVTGPVIWDGEVGSIAGTDIEFVAPE